MFKKISISAISILIVVLILLIPIFINQTNAENQDGVICGKVIDKDSGIGIADTIIRIEKNSEEITTIFSDNQGNYSIVGLDEGNYVLKVLPPPGYNPVQKKVVCIKEKAELKEVNFTLIAHYDYAIEGKVYENDGKTPIEGVEVTAYNADDNMPDGLADVSKSDGTYCIRSLKPSTYNLSCSSDVKAFPIKKDVTLAEAKTSGIDFIAYNNSISGVIKDEKGNSIKDARVSVQYISNRENLENYNVLFVKMMGKISQQVRTDMSGRYKIASLTPGNYNIEIYSAKLERKKNETIIVNQDTEKTNFDFILGITEKVSSIHGKVVKDDNITPIANVFIALVNSSNQPASERLETNNEGMFKIDGLSEGVYYLGAKKNGLATIAKEIQVEGGGKKINITLIMSMPGSISGTVYCKDKKNPAENIKVIAVGNDSGGVANTDKNGFYKIDNLKEGVYKVKAILFNGKEVIIEDVDVKANKETSVGPIYLVD
jgi:hypothetical protein